MEEYDLLNVVSGFYKENGREEVRPQHETHAPSEEKTIFAVYVDLARELQYSIYLSIAILHQH